MTIGFKRKLFSVGDEVRAVNIKPYEKNGVAPPLIEQENYTIKSITIDSKNNQHLDVGLVSEYNYISSRETAEELRNGDTIHWCHPSRFIKIKK